MSNFESSKLIIPYWNHIWQIYTISYVDYADIL